MLAAWAGAVFPGNDAFRARLLAEGQRMELSSPGVLIVAEKGYLSPDEMIRLSSDLREAWGGIPAFIGRAPAVSGRVTLYAYGPAGPISESDVPGERPGETGLMLKLVKEGLSPLFHEATHLLAGSSDSQSLSEGLACVVQDHFRPGRANAFVPQGADPDALAREAVARYPRRFLETIGAPGYRGFSSTGVRYAFYYASWSFARFLIGTRGKAAFLKVYDASGSEEAYAAAYGTSLERLRQEWRDYLGRPRPSGSGAAAS